MKKILILVGKKTEEKKKLAKLVGDFVGSKVEVKLDSFSNISFDIENGEVLVKVSGIDIRTFNIVYIRSIAKSLSFMAGILAYYLKRLNIKILNSRFEHSRALSDKLTSLIILSLNNFPVIPSYFSSRENIEQNADEIIKKFGFPIVAKETTSHHSKGIFVLREKADFQRFLSQESIKKTAQFLFQKFVPIASEYRLLVLGDKVVSVQKMYRDLSGFTSNIDFDRKEEFLETSSVSEEMKKMAVRSAKVLDMQVAGVDTMLTEEGKLIVIEVNSSPGFTYDTVISPEIREFSKYLSEEAEE